MNAPAKKVLKRTYAFREPRVASQATSGNGQAPATPVRYTPYNAADKKKKKNMKRGLRRSGALYGKADMEAWARGERDE